MEAAKPTTDFGPEWQTSIPISIVLLSKLKGNLSAKSCPPALQLIYLIIAEAVESLKFFAV